jgi:MerR family transcriptional regulator, light-induced transcriptional regulator
MEQTNQSNRPASSLSPRALAGAIGVSESSLKRWADEGLLVAERTAGGHRRIRVSEAVRFVREAGLTVVKPELLALPTARGDVPRTDASEHLFRALLEDRAAEARGLIVSLYLQGAGLGWIFDVPMREAMSRLGTMWEHDSGAIFLEHRATETCLRVLEELRRLLPEPTGDAPVAVGGGYGGDPYLIPSTMAGLVLAEAGYRAWNLGADTPVEATLAAIRHYRPRLVWQSFSVPPVRPRDAAAGVRRIRAAMNGGSTVVGGRGTIVFPAPMLPGVHRIGSMTELGAFARGLLSGVQSGVEGGAA